LEQSNAKRKQNVHDPKLIATLVEPIKWVGDEDKHKVHMKGEDRGGNDREASDADGMRIADSEESKYASKDHDRVDDGERDEEDSKSVEVRMAPVVAVLAIKIDGGH
jgi:hypothetical protein